MATSSVQQGFQISRHAADNLSVSEQVPPSVHKRTYQACIPCRKRKVRCDLGPVDDPRDPPCVRCRRESKDCYFSATRRKRRADEEESELGHEDSGIDEYARRNGRKISRASTTTAIAPSDGQKGQRPIVSASYSATSPLDGYNLPGDGSFQQHGPYTPGRVNAKSGDGQDQEVSNETAAALLQTPINIPGDALHLLLKASGQSEDLQRRDIESQRRQSVEKSASERPPAYGTNHAVKPAGPDISREKTNELTIDPAISEDRRSNDRTSIPKETLDTWSRLRFVRAGWFTAREGIAYVNYFYEFINPLTPISLPKLRSYNDHIGLLKDEPMLTITILTIASRYMRLSGSGGQTRSFMVHERLWSYLQDMITRMFWGQEQFGGGFCGAGSRRLGQTNAIKGGLRTLGTIERDDDDDILCPAEEEQNHQRSNEDSSFGGPAAIADWSEPALRSDRMCWSLIGTSYVLAYELGIFGTYTDGSVRRGEGSPDYVRRAIRIERILYVFITQASGRFGLPNMYSNDLNRFTLASLDDNSLSGLYINSLALQAVLEQWTGKLNAMPQTENPVSPASSISSSYASLYNRNEPYIKEVIDSSRIVLKHVVEGLLPEDQLKHAPVRTYFRIISAAMFLLKSFALGGKQDEVAISLQLLDDTVRALRTSVVDDVHICLRIADLLGGLTTSIRSKFVRLPPRALSTPEQARRTAQQNSNTYEGNDQILNQPDRFAYRNNPGDAFQNPLAGISRTYNNPHDSNIAIMPPIGNTYANTDYNFSNTDAGNSAQQQYPQPHQQQQYPMNNDGNNDFSILSAEDWLTLDINPLLGDPSGGLNGGNGSENNQWFGAFGPETHNNLEVLGKFVNDQYRPDAYDDGSLGF
ncbi:zinc finger transcriptional activator [Lecanora helva]